MKVDNIEQYTLDTLKELQTCYSNYLDKSEGVDPDYPDFSFAGGKEVGKVIKGFNAASVRDELGEEEFGIKTGLKVKGDYLGLSKLKKASKNKEIADENSWLDF